MRPRLRAIRRLLKWVLLCGAAAVVLLLMPVIYLEIACRGQAAPRPYRPLITDVEHQRREANTYLTYPEWHIVFAYDGLANVLQRDDEYAFDYAPSVARFWQSACALTRVAGEHGGADWATRQMIHTIGVSFTVEMMAKAVYEETIGRIGAWGRGPVKTPQDVLVRETAADYASFLRQTPWYKYDFDRRASELWASPRSGSMRGWERRLGIGLEFKAKARYAKVIEGAVAATGQAQLTIRSVVAGLDARALSAIPEVRVIGSRGSGLEIETPRYDTFTRILTAIARKRGTILEIAGNDEVMVSLTALTGGRAPEQGTVLLRLPRDGFPGSERLLVNVAVSDLAALLRAYPMADPGLEHVFDY